MKGTAILLLCAVTLAQAEQPQLTLSGKVCNCNPQEATNLCSKNGSDDTLIAHENCNQFYKCSFGSAIAYKCPANLLYNPLAEICDWPENVQCGDRPIVDIGTENEDCSEEDSNNEGGQGGSGGTDDGNNGGTCNCNPDEAPVLCAAEGSSGILVAHQNCNQFYKCDHGIPVVLNCPSGLLYNPFKEQCDWAHNVDCGDRPIVEIEGDGNNGGDEDCGDGGNGNGDNGSSGDNGSGGDNGGNGGTCNCNPGEAPSICGADGSDGILVAHENCNQFYKCDHGVPVVLNCPPGLLYHPYTEQCDWSHNVDCGDRPIVEIDGGGNNGGDEAGDNGSGNGGGNGNGDNGGDSGSGDNGGSCNCNPGEAPGICSTDGSDGTLVAHENCNQFYKCAHGVPVTINCPLGLVYNPYIECCDWPANVNCGDKPIVEVDGGGNGEAGGDNGSGGGNGDNGTGGGSGGNSNEDNGGTCNCNPEEAPGICSTDGSDGTLVAHENCNQFYKCAHGIPVTVTCPPGLVYNPYIECCDWPTNVNCGDKPIVEVGGGGNGGGDNGSGDNGGGENGGGDNGGGDNGGSGTCNCNPGEAPGICGASGSEGVLVAHENCNQFYMCSHGLPVALFCPNGLLYNPYIERCDWPTLVECGDRPIVEVDGGDNGGGDNGGGDNGGGDNGDSDNGGSDNGGGDNGGSGTCNCNPGEAPGICGASGSEGVLVAHENCNQFYKCSHGLPVALFCPAGLNYNPYIERCDWPTLVECGDRPIVEVDGGDNGGGDNGGGDNGDGDIGGGDNDGGENGGSDNGGSGTCNCNPGEAPGICGASGSEGVLVAHENCNQFYKCSHGLPVALFCPAGLLYNPYIERCDWPTLVECGDRPIVEVDGGDNGGGDNGGGDNGDSDNGGSDNGGGDNGGSGTCNCNPGEAPGICGASGSEGVLVAHENCNQFYKCSHGLPVALFCPAGLLYNPYIERCDWPTLVECGDRPIVEVDGGDNGGGDNGGGDNGGGDNGDSDNGGSDNGGGDNGGSGTCNCNPGEAPGICGASGSEGVLVAHENCNQFYKCSHGLPVALFCPAGLLYNPYIERCDWPTLVECGDRPIVEVDGGDNGGGDNGDGDIGGGDNGGGDNGGSDNGGSGTCNCNPGEAPGICGASGSEGVLVAHENCNQFYKCSHGLPVALFCPAGLLYNPYIERCDWPTLVECGDRPIVEVDGGDNGGGDNGGGDNGGGDNGDSDNGGSDNGGGDNGGSGTCNCNPGEAPGICGASGSEGVLVAHENCNQFYKCSHGLPVALFCPDGLLYNPYIERCDWPTLVECGDRPIVEVDGGDNGGGDNGGGDNGDSDNGGSDNGGGDNGGSGTCNCNPGEAPGICGASGSEGVLVAHENCNQFYKCSHGLPVALFCPDGLLYNPYIERCDWPTLVECGDRPIVEVDGGDNGGGNNGDGANGDGDNGGFDNGGGDNGGSGTCNCNPGEAPGICGASGSEGVLVAHENCNQFYKCSHGLPVALFCPAGLNYNPYIERCDWPTLVECGDRPIVEVDGGDNGGGDNGGGDNGGGDNGDGDNGGGDNGGGDNGGSGTCNCNPGEAPGICGASGSEGVLIAHENCNQFYKCSHDLPVALFCPAGLLYNPYIERCDWPTLVECGDRPIVEVDGGDNGGGDNGGGGNGGGDNGGGGGNNGDTCDPSQAPSICASSGSDGVLVAHENCNQFYKCAEGLPIALDCPSSLLYNSVLQVCDWPQNVVCGDRIIPEPEEENNNIGGGDNGGDNNGGDNGGSEGNSNPSEAPAICANAGSNGVLVAHENCDQFYVCSYGKPVALDCPSNLLYNPATEECDWPRNVNCGDRNIPAPESGGEDSPCSCNSREAPSICARSESNGKLIAHENCNQYYLCFEGTPVARSCPHSLFYDPHTEQCLWPVAVSCEGRVIISTSNYASLNKHSKARRGDF